MPYPPLEHCRAERDALRAQVAELEAQRDEVRELLQRFIDWFESETDGGLMTMNTIVKDAKAHLTEEVNG